MLSINTNLSSIIAQRSMKQSTNSLNQAIERMTTGAKINHAIDNAANYSIATNMTTKLGALQVAEDNCAMGLDMIATANGTLDQISEKLQRLRDLAVQASNGTYGAQSKQAINAEANALVDEIERLYKTAEYNGIKLFDNDQKYELPADAPRAQYDGFIKEVVKRDTSAMTKLASVDPNVDLANGTYSINTPEEMKKLADMTNAGLVSAGDEFVLANDIDLGCYENWTPIGDVDYNNGWQGEFFKGKFDGNGYTISNLTIKSDKKYMGLFGYINYTTISNLGLKNVNIFTTEQQASPFCGYASGVTIDNCFAESGEIFAVNAGGLIANNAATTIKNCYSMVDVNAEGAVGGLVSTLNKNTNIENCFVIANLTSLCGHSGGIAGDAYVETSSISNCYIDTTAESLVVGKTDSSKTSISISDCVFVSKVNRDLCSENAGTTINVSNIAKNIKPVDSINLQVSISGEESSRIALDTSFIIEGFSLLRLLGNIEGDFTFHADRLLFSLSTKQIELGATENRLNSALEEISTKYENLVSSRSTLQDADIAEVSSEYIRQQILQQASATLLSTANQSASIALSLI